MSPMAGSAAAVASTAPSVTQGLMGDSTARGPDNERENEVGLEALLRGLYERMCPRDPDYNVRLELVERINMLVASVPACKGMEVVPFGSFASDLFSPWGDLDLSLEGEVRSTGGNGLRRQGVNILHAIHYRLLHTGMARGVQIVAHARVPLVMFTDAATGIACDLSVGNGTGVFKSTILRSLLRFDARCRPLLFLVKAWAKAQGINDPKGGSLNSFALALLVIFHLQTVQPPILPPVRHILGRPVPLGHVAFFSAWLLVAAYVVSALTIGAAHVLSLAPATSSPLFPSLSLSLDSPGFPCPLSPPPSFVCLCGVHAATERREQSRRLLLKHLEGMEQKAVRHQRIAECEERVESMIAARDKGEPVEWGGAGKNTSCVAVLLASFFAKYDAVREQWAQGLAVRPLTAEWGDLTVTHSSFAQRSYSMIVSAAVSSPPPVGRFTPLHSTPPHSTLSKHQVEDPFDPRENCARSVQPHSFPSVCDAFAAAARAFSPLPPAHSLRQLRVALFKWPSNQARPSFTTSHPVDTMPTPTPPRIPPSPILRSSCSHHSQPPQVLSLARPTLGPPHPLGFGGLRSDFSAAAAAGPIPPPAAPAGAAAAAGGGGGGGSSSTSSGHVAAAGVAASDARGGGGAAGEVAAGNVTGGVSWSVAGDRSHGVLIDRGKATAATAGVKGERVAAADGHVANVSAAEIITGRLSEVSLKHGDGRREEVHVHGRKQEEQADGTQEGMDGGRRGRRRPRKGRGGGVQRGGGNGAGYHGDEAWADTESERREQPPPPPSHAMWSWGDQGQTGVGGQQGGMQGVQGVTQGGQGGAHGQRGAQGGQGGQERHGAGRGGWKQHAGWHGRGGGAQGYGYGGVQGGRGGGVQGQQQNGYQGGQGAVGNVGGAGAGGAANNSRRKRGGRKDQVWKEKGGGE
ncbi:unnamed protein product [Closterium sp. NIES-64]|nr:unnamed protein product [Closterium sp. NIES-64]